MAQSTGSIEIALDIVSSESIKSLEQTTIALGKLGNAMTKVSKVNMDSLTNNLTTIGKIDFSNIANSLKPLETINASGLNQVANALNKISAWSDTGFSLTKITLQMQDLAYAIDPFLDKLNASKDVLANFSNALNTESINADLDLTNAKIEKIRSTMLTTEQQEIINANKVAKSNIQLEKAKLSVDKLATSSKAANINFNSLFSLGKLYFWLNYTKRISNAFSGMVSSAIAFEETLNKFQVAMGESYDTALVFVNNMTHAFNLSTESIMNYMATFQNMLQAIGALDNSTSYQLSETLTRMAVDYASLFNVSVETAMSQFQSVLSGQIKSIRTTSGYDVSENTIFAIYQDLGGDKTMRQLTQVEKRLLRIIALQQQMENSGAVGDFEKTISNSSNQLKALSETLQEVGMWIGQLALYYVAPLVENALGVAVALREILKAFNIASGYNYEDFGSGGLFGDIETGAEDAEEAINSLNATLLGFDRLNVLSGSDSSVDETNYELLTEAIKKYSSALTDVENKATDIAEGVLIWLGYLKVVNEETGEVTYVLGEGLTNISKIIDGLGFVGIATALTSIIAKTGLLTPVFTKIGTAIGTAASALAPVLLVVGAIAVGFYSLYESSEKFAGTINNSFSNIVENVKKIWTNLQPLISSLTIALLPIVEKIWQVFEIIAGETVLRLLTAIEFVTALLTGDIQGALDSMNNYFLFIGEAIGDIFGIDFVGWVQDVIGVVKTFATAIYNYFEEPIKAVLSVITTAIGNIKQVFLGFGQIFTVLYNDYIKPFIDNVTSVFDTVYSIFSGLFSFAMNTEFMQNLVSVVTTVFTTIVNGLIYALNTIINAPITALNFLIEALNSISIFGVGFDLSTIPNVNIPMLATGGVISSPTVAMMGEYAGANSNPEIVAPQSIMRETFQEAITPLVQAVIQSNSEVVSAINSQDTNVYMDSRKVSESLYTPLQGVATRKGTVMFSK